MSINNLPKDVLDLFPKWSYQCPNCGKQYNEIVQACVQCGVAYEESKWRVPPAFLKNYEAMSDYAHNVLAPKLTQKQRKRLFEYFTELFSDDFASGNFNLWTSSATDVGSSTLTPSSDTAHDGTYSCKHSIGAFEDDVYILKEVGTQSVLFFRNYVKITNWTGYLSSRYHLIMNVYSEYGNHIASVGIGGTTRFLKLLYRDGSTWYSVDSSTTLDLDTWYCLELEVDQVEEAYRVFLDGEEVSDITQNSTVASWTPDRISVGQQTYGLGTAENTEATIYTDCVVVADTYVGPEEEEEEPPAGAEATFEDNNTSEFTDTLYSSGTVTATDSVAHHGTYSCKCDVNADGNAYAEGYFDIAEQQPVYCRGYFRFNQLPETNRDYTIIAFENTDGPTTVGYIQFINDGGTKKWKMMRTTSGGATYTVSEPSTLEENTWVCVEFAHGETLAKLWIDGTELLSYDDATNQTINRVHVGACSTDIDADDTLEIFIDCIIVANEYIGVETDLKVTNLAVNNVATIGTSVLSTDQNVLSITKPDGSPSITKLSGIHLVHNYPQIPRSNPVIPTYDSVGNGNILFEDTTYAENPEETYPDGQRSSIYLTMVEHPYPNLGKFSPIIATDHGLWVEKDIQTYGALFTSSDPGKGTGGGAIMMGHGFFGDVNFPPCIVLSDANFDELHLFSSAVTQALADLKLRNLTASGAVSGSTVSSSGIVYGTGFNIDAVTPHLHLDVSGVTKGFLLFDGTNVRLASTSGIPLKLSSGNGTITLSGTVSADGISCSSLSSSGGVSGTGFYVGQYKVVGERQDAISVPYPLLTVNSENYEDSTCRTKVNAIIDSLGELRIILAHHGLCHPY